jgi:hydroxymethylglutaryl-CoA reductase (NADPH)
VGGVLRVPRDPDDDYGAAAVEARVVLCERAAGRGLPHLRGLPVPGGSARGKVENLVGFAQVPLGVAGPLVVDTSAGRREVLVPMATTEGAMVASYSRGMRLLAEGGGAWARVVRSALSQCPMLVYRDAAGAQAAAGVVERSFDELARLTGTVTGHGRLLAARGDVLGRRLVLRLDFHTGDAIGINMAARAADLCSQELARRTGAVERYVHGQDVEKRAHARGVLEGRGRSVVCDATVPRAVLERVARTSPEAMQAIGRSYAYGFAQISTSNWLVQAANGLAAVMLACGQDVAYVTEGATGQLALEVDPAGDLYASVTLPSLVVGTVGGGTGQGTAAECLDLLGCRGTGGADVFAEILAATVLAGDLSLMASFCTHEFVAAHERLGRNRPDAGSDTGSVAR